MGKVRNQDRKEGKVRLDVRKAIQSGVGVGS